MSQRNTWKKNFGCEEYICPSCKRNKGMIYLFPDNTIRYVCFCGANISLNWINKRYNFKSKEYTKKDIKENRLKEVIEVIE